MNQLQKQALLDTAKNLALILLAVIIGVSAITFIPIPALMISGGIALFFYSIYMLYQIKLSELERKEQLKSK